MNLHKFKAIIIGSVFGSFVCAVMLVLIALGFVKMKTIPHDIIGQIVLFCAAVSAFFSGYVSLRILKEKGLVYGMASGFFMFLVLLCASVAVSGENLTWITFIRGIIMILTGAIGGIMGVNKRARAR